MRRRKKNPKPKPKPFEFEFDVTFHGEGEVCVEAMDEIEARQKVHQAINNAMGSGSISGVASDIQMDDPRVFEEEICAVCGCHLQEVDDIGQVDYHLSYDHFKDTNLPFKNAVFVCPKHLMRPGKYLKDLRILWREGHWLASTPNRLWKRLSRRKTG